jgi:hypothetical protein
MMSSPLVPSLTHVVSRVMNFVYLFTLDVFQNAAQLADMSSVVVS